MGLRQRVTGFAPNASRFAFELPANVMSGFVPVTSSRQSASIFPPSSACATKTSSAIAAAKRFLIDAVLAVIRLFFAGNEEKYQQASLPQWRSELGLQTHGLDAPGRADDYGLSALKENGKALLLYG
jgi:hypothetical protein